ncbi:hypothetical protein LCGC14_2756700, partial [marine sediment metagenome]
MARQQITARVPFQPVPLFFTTATGDILIVGE